MRVASFYDFGAVEFSGFDDVKSVAFVSFDDDLGLPWGFHDFHGVDDDGEFFVIDDLKHEALNQFTSDTLFDLVSFGYHTRDESLPAIPSTECFCRDGGTGFSLSCFLWGWERVSGVVLAGVLYY